MNIAAAVHRLRASAYWRDVAWLASGNTTAQAIGVFAMPVLTRLYAPADFAQQNLFIQVLGFAVVLLSGRYEYFVQLPKQESGAIELVRLVLSMSIVGCAITTPLVWTFRTTLSNWIGVPTLTTWLALVPLTAALVSYSVALQNFAQRRGQYRQSSLSEVVNKGAYAGTALAGHWAFAGPAGLLLASGTGALAKICWLSRLPAPAAGPPMQLPEQLGYRGTGWWRSLRNAARSYAHFSGSVVLSHLLMSCTTIIPSIFIARAYGAESLGQFSLASTTVYLPTSLIGTAIGQVYYQRAAQMRAAGRDFGGLWRATSKRLLTLGIPVFALLALVSRWIYPLIFGTDWTEAGRYASLMSLSAFFAFISTPLDRGCLVVGAWAYIPLWHAARVLSTGAVAWIAWRNGWSVNAFVVALVAQMSSMFLIDYWAEYRFAVSGAGRHAT